MQSKATSTWRPVAELCGIGDILGLSEGAVRVCESFTGWLSVPSKQAKSAETSDFDKPTVLDASVSVIEHSWCDYICYRKSEVAGRA